MTSDTIGLQSRQGASRGWLLLGGIAVGTIDILFAWTFWASRGATVAGIFKTIASGWLGPASREGGAAAIMIGAVSHYLIATTFVVAYFLAARRLPALVRRPVACGVPYGVFLYAAMNFVVVPLSAAPSPRFDDIAWVASSIAMHAVFGVMCAISARLALGRE